MGSAINPDQVAHMREMVVRLEQRADPTNTHISEMELRVTRNEGRLAAHGDGGRDNFERIVRAWCIARPALRGEGVEFLCWLFDQAHEAEDRRIMAAEHAVQRAVWPLFQRLAPRADIIAAAALASDGVLDEIELDVVLTDICARAAPRRRRAR
jgi:hypothetical protein